MASADPTKTFYVMTLFVAGSSLLTKRAVDNVRRICSNQLEGRCRLDVVDIAEDPDTAEAHGIVAVPTLIKGAPLPEVRLVGDMSDTARVMSRLDIEATEV